MAETMTVPCVLVKYDEPKIYNKGTASESSRDTFLHCYAPTDERAKQEADRLNKDASGCQYYASRSELFDTTGS